MSFYGFLLLTWLKWSLLCNVDCCWSFWVKCLISSSTKSLRISNRISARKCLNSSFLNFPEHPIHRRIFRLLPRPGSFAPMSELPIISRTSRILFPSEIPTHRRHFRLTAGTSDAPSSTIKTWEVTVHSSFHPPTQTTDALSLNTPHNRRFLAILKRQVSYSIPRLTRLVPLRIFRRFLRKIHWGILKP